MMKKSDYIEILSKGIIANFPELKKEKINELCMLMEIEKIPKRKVIVSSGKYYGKIVFVISGLFRAYYTEHNNEHTFWFREEHTIFASHRCILQNKPSSITYQSIEDSVIATIDYKLLKDLTKVDEDVSRSIIIVLEGLILELIDRVEDFITNSPEKRYITFIEKHSNIVNRVPQNQLASFLGITPVSFSRIKSRIMNR